MLKAIIVSKRNLKERWREGFSGDMSKNYAQKRHEHNLNVIPQLKLEHKV